MVSKYAQKETSTVYDTYGSNCAPEHLLESSLYLMSYCSAWYNLPIK